MSFSERWFLKSLSKDKIDNNDKKAKAGVSVNSANIVSRGMKSKNQHTDLFHDSGEAIKVYLPPIDTDVWLCSNQQARQAVLHEEIACFLYEDLVYICQGKPGAERLSRLQEVYVRRHPVTQSVLDLFNGKTSRIELKGKTGTV
jgi:hypothetical protein